MKILVTGSNGLVGNAIHKLLTNSDHEYINTSWSLGGIASHVIDITDNESIEKVVEEFRPDAIINSAAMANVDNCEVESDRCWKVNVEGVKNLVNTCDNYEIHLVHISTDYIFDGKKVGGIYTEDDEPAPQGFYAESKLAGEKVILSSSISSSILRTILVYGMHERHNIVTFVKEKLEKGEQVNLVSDQVRMPTYVDDLARACISAAEKKAIKDIIISEFTIISLFKNSISVGGKRSRESLKVITKVIHKKIRMRNNLAFIEIKFCLSTF